MTKNMPMDEKNQIVTSLKVDPQLWKQAKSSALQCDITLGELIDEAVRDWIEKQKEKLKE